MSEWNADSSSHHLCVCTHWDNHFYCMWRFQPWSGIMVIAQLPCCATLHCTNKWMPHDSDVILECKLKVHLLCSVTIDACAPWGRPNLRRPFGSISSSNANVTAWPPSTFDQGPYLHPALTVACVCVCLYTTWFPKTAEKVLGVAIESSYYPIYLARHDRTSACLVDSLLAEDTTLNHITTESWLASCLVFARRNLVRALNSHQHQGFLMKKYWEPRRDWRRLNQLYELMCHQSQQQEIHSIICAENQRCANEK